MIRGQNLPAITQIADSDVLIVDSASGGTRKITYAQLCQAVKQTLGIREVIDSVNITEDGYLMGGKVIADELAKLNDDIAVQTYTTDQFINISSPALTIYNACRIGNIVFLYGNINGGYIDPGVTETVAQLTLLKPVGVTVACLIHSGGITQANFRIEASGAISVSVEDKSAYYTISVVYLSENF